MSELINTRSHNESFRRNLLMNVSALALMGTVCGSFGALASPDEGRSTVWIELGGQLERVDTPQTALALPFFSLASPPVLEVLTGAQRPSRYSPSIDGKITFAPEATNWVFSAAIRYGRVRNARHPHYQTPGFPTFRTTFNGVAGVAKPHLRNFGDGQADFSESHSVLDFRAGKDIGLGMFGSNASSIISAGVRYAQFTSSSDVTLHARPVLGYDPPHRVLANGKYASGRPPFHQTYTAVLHTTRNTHALGPSVSWDGSMPVMGRDEGMMIAFDWGVNAAALFGRQRTHDDHHTTGYYFRYINNVKVTRHYAHSDGDARSRAVFIPNVGGFAGLSLKFPNVKVSLGYRGDFFFNATDSGVDVRDAANRNFYGPFASVSIGLGG